MKTVGVLALKGDFEAHSNALARAGAKAVPVRSAAALNGVDGLILPGGESTTMLRLLHQQSLFQPLLEFGRSRPVFGTCAGLILLAKEVTHPSQECLGLLDVTVERNGYGRQIDSRVARIHLAVDGAEVPSTGDPSDSVEAVFIRAPIVRSVGPVVRVLAEYDGTPVLIEQDRHLAATFHPELSSDMRIHQLFLKKL